jgi:hypothetical protein
VRTVTLILINSEEPLLFCDKLFEDRSPMKLLPSLLLLLIGSVAAQPGGDTGQNVHVTFGDVADCVAPACGTFSLSIP